MIRPTLYVAVGIKLKRIMKRIKESGIAVRFLNSLVKLGDDESQEEDRVRLQNSH